jgi:signal transduction histidine kinase
LEHIKKIVNVANKLTKFVTDLLEFSYAGRGEMYLEKTDLNLCIEEAKDNLYERIEKRHVKITADKFPIIYCDKRMLVEVFQNIISNAIKFSSTDRSPEISIKYLTEGLNGNCVVEITDNGIGIPENKTECVFIGFKRLHPKHKYEGTGIGLAICKKIIERHGGKIYVASKEGVGTTFGFVLPKAILDA